MVLGDTCEQQQQQQQQQQQRRSHPRCDNNRVHAMR